MCRTCANSGALECLFVYSGASNKERPEASIVYDERFVRDVFDTNNLEIRHIRLGGWCGRKKNLFDQDVLLASK